MVLYGMPISPGESRAFVRFLTKFQKGKGPPSWVMKLVPTTIEAKGFCSSPHLRSDDYDYVDDDGDHDDGDDKDGDYKDGDEACSNDH